MKNMHIRIAEDICELNSWRTPNRIKKRLKRELTEDEISLAMDVLETYVPESAWIKTWQDQDFGRRPKRSA